MMLAHGIVLHMILRTTP